MWYMREKDGELEEGGSFFDFVVDFGDFGDFVDFFCLEFGGKLTCG